MGFLSWFVDAVVVLDQQVHDPSDTKIMGVDQRVSVAQEQFLADDLAGLHPGVDEVAVGVDYAFLPVARADEECSHARSLVKSIGWHVTGRPAPGLNHVRVVRTVVQKDVAVAALV